MYTPSLLFGISASLDALLVGASYGLRGIHIKIRQNLAISLITLLGTCLSVGLGKRLADFLPGSVGNYAGSVILMILGLYYIAKCLPPLQRCSVPERHERKCQNPRMPECQVFPTCHDSRGRPSCLMPKEVLTLSLTLSMNNLSAGLSASLTGLALVPTAVATFVCSVLFLLTGNHMGTFPALQLAGRIADPLSGLLLIGLGLVQLLR